MEPMDREHAAGPAEHFQHRFDLAAHEQYRLAAVLAACPDLDPAAVLADETAAHAMLYSDLDDDQRATYRLLVESGMLDA